jgi:6-phosphogluconate dehydrogenase (decarboxylating)
MQSRSGEFAAITEAERQLVAANLSEMKKALLAAGYNIAYDYDKNQVSVVKAQAGSVVQPWIMDLSGFNPTMGDVDFNLIPLYAYYA